MFKEIPQPLTTTRSPAPSKPLSKKHSQEQMKDLIVLDLSQIDKKKVFDTMTEQPPHSADKNKQRAEIRASKQRMKQAMVNTKTTQASSK